MHPPKSRLFAIICALLPLLAASAGAQTLQPTPFDPYNASPLFAAVRANDYSAAQQLLSSGEAVNYVDVNGQNALMLASTEGRCEMASLLLKYKARPDAKDKDGNTALMRAAERGFLPCVQALIDARADLNAGNRQGVTALMKAAQNGRIDVIKALLAAKADGTLTDHVGFTALSYAENARQRRAADALRAAGMSN